MRLTRIIVRSARDDAVEDSKQGCGRGPSSENDAGLGDAALYALVELMFAVVVMGFAVVMVMGFALVVEVMVVVMLVVKLPS